MLTKCDDVHNVFFFLRITHCSYIFPGQKCLQSQIGIPVQFMLPFIKI